MVDSGIDGTTRPSAGSPATSPSSRDPESETGTRYVDGPHEDLVGHGTACAGIIRGLAPDVEIYSVRVLGANLKGKGALFLAGIEWAIEHGMDVVNMSLSSKSEQCSRRCTTWPTRPTSATASWCARPTTRPDRRYPSQFASVVSVAATPGTDPYTLAYNPHPPVEFAAVGIDIEVPWTGGLHRRDRQQLRGAARRRAWRP